MSKSRSDFIDHLKNLFKNDAMRFAECLVASKEMLEHNFFTRVFDHFPQLLEDKLFLNFTNRYQSLLLKMRERDRCELTLTASEERTVAKFEKELAQAACSALLQTDGTIRKELIELMNWTAYQEKLTAEDLVTGFLATLNLQMQAKIQTITNTYSTMNAIINNFATKHERQWSENAIRYYKNKDYIIAANTLGGAVAAGVAVGTGLAIYGLYKQNLGQELEKLSVNILNPFKKF